MCGGVYRRKNYGICNVAKIQYKMSHFTQLMEVLLIDTDFLIW